MHYVTEAVQVCCEVQGNNTYVKSYQQVEHREHRIRNSHCTQVCKCIVFFIGYFKVKAN